MKLYPRTATTTAAFVLGLLHFNTRVQVGESFCTGCPGSTSSIRTAPSSATTVQSRRRITTTTTTTTAKSTRSFPNGIAKQLALRRTVDVSLLGHNRNVNENENHDDDTSRSRSSSSKVSVVDQDRTVFENEFDKALQEPSLSRAITLLEDHPDDIPLTRERWSNVFAAIERRTTEAEENTENIRFLESSTSTSTMSQYPLQSPARNEMTKFYDVLANSKHLRLFGAAKDFPPAAGSQTVTPVLLETITGLNMVALTPKPTNTLLLAGAALALTEVAISLQYGWDLNFLTFATFTLAVLDRILTNGAVMESFVKVFNPGVQQKIIRHEAGHFLTAYLLGLPVEGCVLSAWAALKDARFDKRQVSAGTSFFDPVLSHQINKAVVTRSSVNRYSIVVMAGIAAEAIHFGRADGGAGDEMALVTFLSQLNGAPKTGGGGGGGGGVGTPLPVWNNESIRNQARWGALQAILLLREYREAYDALVDALERGADLGDCIYAIEKAGRDHQLECLTRPLGFIMDDGQNGIWTTDIPKNNEDNNNSKGDASDNQGKDFNKELSLQTLQVYREQMEERLKDIDQRLNEINGENSYY